MAAPNHVLVELGSRWSSSLVLAEAELALHRWRDDVDALRSYGWGETRRQRFEALVDRLRARHDEHKREGQGSSAPHDSLPDRAAARRWHDRAVSILESAELDHPALGAVIAALPPPGDGAATLVDALRAALGAVVDHHALLDREAADDTFSAEGAALCALIGGELGPRPASASDREEIIDSLDGEVYLTIRGLNRAAGRAFAGDSRARADAYVFQFLVTIQRGDEPVPPRRSDPPPRT